MKVVYYAAGQTAGDMFHEPALPSELSQDNDVVVNDVDDADIEAEHHTVDEEDAEDDAGAVSGDEENVVETTLQPDDDILMSAQRQHSTTEYLPGMLHSSSPPGLLPKFPSWSLLRLGDCSSYNPTTGC